MKNPSILLNSTIDEYCKELEQNLELFKLGKKKCITHKHVHTYTKNLEYLFKSNANDLKIGQISSKSNLRLSKFYEKKWREEVGHDQWARNDLKAMKQYGPENGLLLKEMIELTIFLHETVKTNPITYLSYMYFAEYMTAKLGPIWMKMLQDNLGIQPQSLTALSNHIELDGDHSAEVLDFIDSLNLSETEALRMEKFCSELNNKYLCFFNAIARIPTDAPITSIHRNSPQISTST